jgi:hypothetical protein
MSRRFKVTKEYPNHDIGFSGPVGKVYIHKHISGSMVKVGETSKSSQARLKGYSKDWDLKGFSFHKEYLVPLDARKEIERSAQYKLNNSRIAGKRGPRELFLCGVNQAERAVEKAISESEAIAKAKKRQIAKAQYDAALENYRTLALQFLKKSPWYQTKATNLESFIANTSFTKKSTRSQNDKVNLAFAGAAFVLVGVGLTWLAFEYFTLAYFFFGPGAIWVGIQKFMEIGSAPPDVTDQAAVDQRTSLEREIKNAEHAAIKTAENEFTRSNNIDDFINKTVVF